MSEELGVLCQAAVGEARGAEAIRLSDGAHQEARRGAGVVDPVVAHTEEVTYLVDEHLLWSARHRRSILKDETIEPLHASSAQSSSADVRAPEIASRNQDMDVVCWQIGDRGPAIECGQQGFGGQARISGAWFEGIHLEGNVIHEDEPQPRAKVGPFEELVGQANHLGCSMASGFRSAMFIHAARVSDEHDAEVFGLSRGSLVELEDGRRRELCSSRGADRARQCEPKRERADGPAAALQSGGLHSSSGFRWR